jgi:IS30 family transposase
MAGNARTWFAPKQRAELWERWKSGQCVADIARALERRSKSGVYRVLALNGGIAPVPRRRAARALRLEEREEISRGIAAGRSIRRIAQSLARSPSTVSREIRRNGGCSAYRASEADTHAWERALRPKPCRLARHAELRWRVAQKLALQWSPKQISGWLKRQFPADQGMQVSHETIYRSLFIQTRGVLKKELMAHLRTARQMRQAKGGTTKNGLGQIVDAVSIRERPAEADDRAVPGHWEGELLSGANNTHIATLVERHTRFVMLLKIPSKDTTTVVAALAKHVRKLPSELRRSLTWDRGKEMADHKSFTIATKVQVYFCDPRSPWQRGSNENTNGLLRQFFPKGTDLSRFSQAYLNKIATRLNQRPRETLGFETPADRLRAVLQRPVELTTQSGHCHTSAGLKPDPLRALRCQLDAAKQHIGLGSNSKSVCRLCKGIRFVDPSNDHFGRR